MFVHGHRHIQPRASGAPLVHRDAVNRRLRAGAARAWRR
jgi:hypothetical protein